MIKKMVLWSGIDDPELSSFFEKLTKTDWTEIEQLDLYINSYGGELFGGLALYDYLRALPVVVHTIAIGKVMSAGTLIFLAGEIRSCYKHTYFMVHNLSDNLSGTIQSLETDMALNKILNEQMVNIYKEHTNIKHKKEWRKRLMQDTYIDAKEAKEIGFVHGIIV